MAIGVPYAIGAYGGGNTVFTTNVDVPAGSLIVVCWGQWSGSATILGITDSVGNTYVIGSNSYDGSVTTSIGGIAYCSNSANDLPSGSTITLNAPGLNPQLLAIACDGANGALDVSVHNVNYAAGPVSLSSGALSATPELIIGSVSCNDSGTNPFVAANGFTVITQGNYLGVSYLIPASTGSVTFELTAPASVGGSVNMISIRETSGVGATVDLVGDLSV